MRVNWCASCGGGRNFGDQLGPILLRHYGVKKVEWAPPGSCELVTVGSILSKVPNGWEGTVWGTGFIRAGLRKDLSRARVLAVRGEHTRAAARGSQRAVLGDPGVLVVDLPRVEVFPLGSLVIPHYVDKDIARRHLGAAVAAITEDSAALLGKIAAASIVYTSTLHGLIAADALGVPHVYEPHGAVIGAGFKFQDYASAFGERIRPGRERLTPRAEMTRVQEALRRALDEVLSAS
jgi:hypothetical protein